jgi:hypothetical protein
MAETPTALPGFAIVKFNPKPTVLRKFTFRDDAIAAWNKFIASGHNEQELTCM